ncbi:formin-like protein 18 isoform X2 [Cicer arietinum]|uniref:formin-like protein 18 isoform X2 n=1 Tax=Cicer arietinum TaxID=3827 RepID=UPI003CC52910
MAMLRKLFFRKPPDGLLEICERVYVFDCCFTTEAWNEEKYKVYMDGIVGQLRENVPDASILVFNFREEETKSLMANIISEYDITIMDYPRHYEGCPVLKMELIHHFLRSSESWLSLGHHNVLLMHCERGGWLVLAFMLAALLIYRKVYSGEQRTLDMVYRQSPNELLHLLTPLNPIPSQLRYLQYVSRRNVALDWPPLDRALMLDCIILRFIPNFDGQGGCHPLFRIYGQDPFSADKSSKILYSTPRRSKNIRAYKQGECELIKIDINCHIQGDVVIESINLNDDMEHETMMFRVMFNTTFVRSNILMLNCDEIDVLWDAKDHFPKDFRAEILFSEMDAAASVIADGTSCFEEKEGLPIEAFATVQEIFNHVDWMNPKAEAALNVLQHISTSAIMNDKLDKVSDQHVETASSLRETGFKMPQRNSYEATQSRSSTKQPPNNDMSGKEDKTNKVDDIPQQANTSDIICQQTFCSSERRLDSSKCATGSSNIDIKLQASNLDSSGSVDASLSPGTPPLRPPSTAHAKEVQDSPAHKESPPRHILPLHSGHQSEDISYSPVSSSTPGTQLLSAFDSKSPAATVSRPSLSSVSSIQPSSLLSCRTPLNGIQPVKTRLESSPSQPPTPPPPPTPPLKDHKVITDGPLTPSPPPPPKKELLSAFNSTSTAANVSHPSLSSVSSILPSPPLSSKTPLNDILPDKTRLESSSSQPPTPPPPLKDHKVIRAGPPTPPPPPKKELLSAFHSKSQGATVSHPPLSSVSSIQPSPPLSSKTPLNDIPLVKTKLESFPSQSQTPPPPLKDHKVIRAGPPTPPPPPPSPPKKELHVEAGPPPTSPIPSPMNEQPHVRDGLSPPPPPLKAEQPATFKPPPPPPPPHHSREVASPTIAPPAPPPPPSATLSSGNPNPSSKKSPPAPPPPIPFGKEGLKPGSAFPMSLSVRSDGNNVSGTTGPQSSSPTGPKGRGLSPPKKELHVEAGPPPTSPIPSPMNEQPHVRDGLSPPPPPLKAEQPATFKPPPPPPPPHHSREVASPTIAPPAPPPPPSATLSSGNPNPSSKKSPPAPPPPIPFGKEGLKPGSAFPMSLSVRSDGNNVSGTTGPQSSSPTGPKGRGLSRTVGSKNNSKKLKPLHWMKLSRAVQGSLWDETQKSSEASKAPEIDMSELESLFSAAAPSSNTAKKSNVQSSVRPKSEKVQLVEHRRAYNCEIMLSKVKVPLRDLMGSVLALEESALDTDQVENLIKFCPTKEEMEIVKNYNGEKDKLGRCEQFFMELMKVPRVESKLRVFSFKIQFHSQVSDLRNSLNVVNAAAEEIRNSVKLKRIMQTILTLGNALNQGTARGSAIGFRLDSLLKLTETRARNNKMTLMHYLCKIQLKFLAEEMQAINKGLEKVVQELSTSENDGPISETFRKKLKVFLCSAEAEVRSLASIYSGVGRNVDVLILYFGEDPSRCTFEQVVTTLLNFTRMFNKAHEENCKQLELEMKKTAESEKKKCESERILPTAIRTGNVK